MSEKLKKLTGTKPAAPIDLTKLEKTAVQIALLLLNAQKITVAANVFEFQLNAFNKDWAKQGGRGSFVLDAGNVIFITQKSK